MAWSDHLTEDVELQNELLLDGVLVAYEPDAVVEAAMPTTLEGSRTQNERWERGRIELARRFVPRLVGWRAAAAAASPPWTRCSTTSCHRCRCSATGATAVAAAAACLPRMGRSRTGRIGRRLAWASVAALTFHVLAGLRWAGAPRATYRALLRAPQMAWWKLRLWLRVLAHPNEVRWTRTQRNQP